MSLQGVRVLVVEDESIVAMMMEMFLEELGCEVVQVASRLADASEIAKVVTIDVATLDINLAGQLSYPVAAILRARAIPFVFATGYGLGDLPAEMQAVPVLAKPFTQEQLASVLSAAVNIP